MKKSLIEKLDSIFEEYENTEIEEANVTGNLDGGDGPAKTPHAFTDDESGMNNDHIEVLGYKRTSKTNMHTKRLHELERKMERKITEISYKEYKSDNSKKDYQKINDSIKQINRMVYEVEKMVTQNLKLKKESSVSMDSYWKSTQSRFSKISERMIRISQKIKELNS